MKIIPMGDYYVWHCDWCDSTNYTIWTRIESERLACSACHQTFSVLEETPPAFSRQRIPESGSQHLTL